MEPGHVGGLHAASRLRKHRSRTRNFVLGRRDPEAPRLLFSTEVRNPGWDPVSLSRPPCEVEARESSRRVISGLGRMRAPFLQAAAMSAIRAPGLALRSQPARGMPGKRWEGGFRHRTQKHAGLPREGHTVTAAGGALPWWWHTKRDVYPLQHSRTQLPTTRLFQESLFLWSLTFP